MPIGMGSFSQVWLALNKDNNKFYAAKVLDKNFIMEKGMRNNIKLELKIMKFNDHPNLMKVKYSYQTSKQIIFVSDYSQGGDMLYFFHKFLKVKRIPEENAKFYTACVILGLSYLHDIGIVFRDLKMENILIDK